MTNCEEVMELSPIVSVKKEFFETDLSSISDTVCNKDNTFKNFVNAGSVGQNVSDFKVVKSEQLDCASTAVSLGVKLNVNYKDGGNTQCNITTSVDKNVENGIQTKTSKDFVNIQKSVVNDAVFVERKHSCTICGSEFQYISQLSKHMGLVHNGEIKGFSCDMCSKVFSNSGNMYKHRKVVHFREKNYTCIYCDKKFSNSSHLADHQKRIHKVDKKVKVRQAVVGSLPSAVSNEGLYKSNQRSAKMSVGCRTTHDGEKRVEDHQDSSCSYEREQLELLHDKSSNMSGEKSLIACIPKFHIRDHVELESSDDHEENDLINVNSLNSVNGKVRVGNLFNSTDEVTDEQMSTDFKDTGGDPTQLCMVPDSQKYITSSCVVSEQSQTACTGMVHNNYRRKECERSHDKVEFRNASEVKKDGSEVPVETEGTAELQCGLCREAFSSKEDLLDHNETMHIEDSNFGNSICDLTSACSLDNVDRKSAHDVINEFKCPMCATNMVGKQFKLRTVCCESCGHMFVKKPVSGIVGSKSGGREITLNAEDCKDCSWIKTETGSDDTKEIKQRGLDCKETGEMNMPKSPFNTENSFELVKNTSENSQQVLAEENLIPVDPLPAIKTETLDKNNSSLATSSVDQNAALLAKNSRCGECGKEFRLLSYLKAHMAVHMKDLPLLNVCDICGKQFQCKSNLLKHRQNIHLGEKLYQCRVCMKKFATNHHLNRHKTAMHPGVEGFFCPACLKNLIVKVDSQVPSGGRTINCDNCGHNFQDVDTSNTKKIQKPKSYLCQICGKDMKTKSSLARHQFVHAESKPFPCTLCGKSYATKTRFKQHELRHAGKLPYQCGQCGKAFAEKYAFFKHLQVHTGERPFPCDQCEKKFRTKAELGIHLLIHTDVRPYQCEICLRNFRQGPALKQHLKVHAGIKDFSCSVCQKTFSRSTNLRSHFRIHSGDKPYKCHLCDASYRYSSNLNMHIKRHGTGKIYTRTKDKHV